MEHQKRIQRKMTSLIALGYNEKDLEANFLAIEQELYHKDWDDLASGKMDAFPRIRKKIDRALKSKAAGRS